MQLSVHFASISSTENLQTNQFTESSQEQKFLGFWHKLQWFLSKSLRTKNIEAPKVRFSEKYSYLTDFWHVSKLEKVCSGKYYAQKMPLNILRLVVWFANGIFVGNQSKFSLMWCSKNICLEIRSRNTDLAFWREIFESLFFKKLQM